MNIIVDMLFGSKLYGLDTKNSDTDYKGIYLPELNDVILNKHENIIKNNTSNDSVKNTKDDIDSEYYSLQYFINKCKDGNLITWDMLHVPFDSDKILQSSQIWEYITSRKKMFYTEHAFNKQLAFLKSVVKPVKNNNDRIILSNIRNLFLESIKTFDKNSILTIGDILNSERNKNINYNIKIPSNIISIEQIQRYEKNLELSQLVYDNYIKIYDTRFPYHTNIYTMLEWLECLINKLGPLSKGFRKDYKQLSHATRIGYQLLSILNTGNFNYPLKENDEIMRIKLQLVDYFDYCMKLDDVISQITIKLTNDMNKDKYPKVPENDFWDKFILSTFKRNASFK